MFFVLQLLWATWNVQHNTWDVRFLVFRFEANFMKECSFRDLQKKKQKSKNIEMSMVINFIEVRNSCSHFLVIQSNKLKQNANNKKSKLEEIEVTFSWFIFLFFFWNFDYTGESKQKTKKTKTVCILWIYTN